MKKFIRVRSTKGYGMGADDSGKTEDPDWQHQYEAVFATFRAVQSALKKALNISHRQILVSSNRQASNAAKSAVSALKGAFEDLRETIEQMEQDAGF
jgi:hypothetical protein